MLTAAKLLVTAGLGAAYLGVAFLTAHPHVDSEYKAHYIHRVADCWIPRALRAGAAEPAPPELIKVGQIGYPGVCRYLRRDWFSLEDWGAWVSGKDATLWLPRRPGARGVELTLRGAPLPGSVIRAQFVLNGQTIEEDFPPGVTKHVVFPLPPQGNAYNPAMEIHTLSYAHIPDIPPETRPRNVGVGLVAIRYLPVQPAVGATSEAAVPQDLGMLPERDLHQAR